MTTKASRQALLDNLTAIAPGLAAVNILPSLTHFWFDGARVTACNDHITMSVKCESAFTGGVPGKLLLDMLSTSNAEGFTIDAAEEANIVLRLGKSKIKLPHLDMKHMPAIPALPQDVEALSIDGNDLVSGLSVCMLSAGADILVPSQYHFTVIMIPQSDGTLHLFATDDATIAMARVKCDNATRVLSKPIVAPASFCQQLIKLMVLTRGGKSRFKLMVVDDLIIAKIGAFTLHGRLITNLQVPDFYSIVKQHDKDTKKKCVDVPARFESCLNRAALITGTRMDWNSTSITIKQGEMRMSTKSETGLVSDVLNVAGHDAVETSIEPRLVKRGVAVFSKFCITPSFVLFRDANSMFLVSSTMGSK